MSGGGAIAFHCFNSEIDSAGHLVMHDPIAVSDDDELEGEFALCDRVVMNLHGLSVTYFTSEQWTARVQRFKEGQKEEEEAKEKALRIIRNWPGRLN